MWAWTPWVEEKASEVNCGEQHKIRTGAMKWIIEAGVLTLWCLIPKVQIYRSAAVCKEQQWRIPH